MTSPADQPDWARVNDVFHEALETAPEKRETFLDTACAGDDGLRREVVSLIDAHEQAGDLFDRPPADRELLDAGGPGPAGLLIGHYRVVEVLGEGGMGVVYLAEDTRLGRTVALKALPSRFTSDPSRRERLRREARAAAALNHPGIAGVYALEEIEGQLFIASEYVPGETLRAELERGPAAAERALETGIALARALAAAHQRGIIHRDLKPENVVRTPNGDLKILDFGIARSLEDVSARGRLTGDDTLLGTPAYMSPEQIRGGHDDPRSDLFALGALVYEVASGSNPFDAPDPAATIVRVLESDPPALRAPDAARPSEARMLEALDQVVRICLNKTPAGRYGSAEDLAHALEAARGTGTHAAIPAAASRLSGDTAGWWWQFHQGAASAGYLVLVALVWMARQEVGTLASLLIFLSTLIGSVTASLLRLHLWFAVRSYPLEAQAQRERTQPWLRLADVLFAGSVLTAGLLVLTIHSGLAVTLVACAVAVVVVFAVVEPATTRAAFDSR